MRKELIISTILQETRVALLENDELVEFLVERRRTQNLAGNIYKGRVTKVLPGMQSAFVDIGLERDAFLYVSDVFEDTDEYEEVVASAEEQALSQKEKPPSSSRGSGRKHSEDKESQSTTTESEAPKKLERKAPKKRSSRRERRPDSKQEASREVKDESRKSNNIQLLPGESLAKYTSTDLVDEPEQSIEITEAHDDVPENTQGLPVSEPATTDESVIIETALGGLAGEKGEEQPHLETDPESGLEQASEKFSVESSGEGFTETERSELPPADNAVSEEKSENVDEDEADDASIRARIRERRDKQSFSRRPTSRRPRRRTGGKSESKVSDADSNHRTISELLKEGQEILVQISKEPIGKKGARITSHIALPGRYLVYLPNVKQLGVSRKIDAEEERARLRQVIEDNRNDLTGGFIVRTAAEGRDERELIQDLRFLGSLWAEIRSNVEKASGAQLIHSDLTLIQRVLRDQLSDEFKAIRLDNESEYEKVLEFVNRFQPNLVSRVRLHLKDNSIFEEYGLHQEIDKALRSKVWLKSGGYIVVNQTEALVAIDVNSGKFVGKSNRLEDTIVRVNIDAVREIVRQIRLRNLGGIIIVDFIDMEERKNRQIVMQKLEEELVRDRSPSKILQFNDFGLVAITRKRTHPSLERILGAPCPRCSGSGFVKAVETVCYEILQEVKKMLVGLDGEEITVRVSPEVAKALKSGEFIDFTELEDEARKDVRVQSDPLLNAEQFNIC